MWRRKVEGKPVSLSIDEKEYGKDGPSEDRLTSSAMTELPPLRTRTTRIACASCHGYHGEGQRMTLIDALTVRLAHESKEVMKDPKDCQDCPGDGEGPDPS